MDYQQILYAVEEHVATITLNRPERMNAYTVRMMDELIDAFDRADADDEVRAVIVTGAGKAFCAGADLELGAKTFEAGGNIDYASQEARDFGGRLSLRIFQSLKPVIGAINGAAVGIGATMTLPMDIRLLADNARVGFIFARRGIVPEAASSYFLPRIVGIGTALDWCLTGRMIQGQEAVSAGLARAVVPAADLLTTAQAIAREIADNAAPVSAALTRAMLWRGLGMTDPMQAHCVDSRAILSRGRSGDAKEGVMSFLEKRPANFPDRVSTDMPDFFPWWDEQTYS